jgi:superoxide reductase
MPNIRFYRCNVCGNIMVMLVKKGEKKTCCEKVMTVVEPNTTDGADEKHIPVLKRENGIIHVTVGSIPHPMLPEHYIEMITIDAGAKTEIAYLAPGLEPKVDFADAGTGTIYEYCNIHGLWKIDF